MQPIPEENAANGEPLTIAAAVEAAFGARRPPGNVLAGSLLLGVPRYQFRVLSLCGVVKVVLQMSSFLPIYTHGKYVPPSCSLARGAWPAPERGSVAYEWALCCSREWLLAAASSAFFAGCGVGAIAGGFLSDRLGRRPVVVYGLALNAACLLLSAAAPNVVVYAVLRFVTGAANIAVILANFTLAVELVPEGWRSPLSGFLFSCSALGELALVPLAAAISAAVSPGWRPLTLAAGVVTALPTLVLWLVLPESPRWLHACGLQGQAIEVVCKAAKTNMASKRCDGFAELLQALQERGLAAKELPAPGVPEGPEEPETEAAVEPEREQENGEGALPIKAGGGQAGGLSAAVRRLSTWVMALLWFTASMTYYGISLAVKEFSHGLSLYASAGMSACIEVPAALLAAWLLEQQTLGRRLSTTGLFAVGGAFCMLLPAMPAGATVYVAVAGKLFLTSAFDSIYVYASEVFETAVRGSAMGFCSFAARLGSISAPQASTFLTADQVSLLFGAFSLVSASLCRAALPETLPPPAAEGKEVAYGRLTRPEEADGCRSQTTESCSSGNSSSSVGSGRSSEEPA